jgi:hypothetical protein
MVCKWAAGIADNVALSILFDCMGVDLPIVVAPNVNPALARHPAFQRSVRKHCEWGPGPLRALSLTARLDGELGRP